METMLECQMLRPGHGQHHGHPGPRPGLGGVSMFRPVRPAPHAPVTPVMTPEERAMIIARSNLLRSPLTSPALRPGLPPPAGLQQLWCQWAQLQQLSSALQAVNPSPPAAALFSNLLSQAQQRYSPYHVSSPSPPTQRRSSPGSRSPSPVNV